MAWVVYNFAHESDPILETQVDKLRHAKPRISDQDTPFRRNRVISGTIVTLSLAPWVRLLNSSK